MNYLFVWLAFAAWSLMACTGVPQQFLPVIRGCFLYASLALGVILFCAWSWGRVGG